jgi:hypothetical protein
MSNPTRNPATAQLRLKLMPVDKPTCTATLGALEPELLDLIRAIARAHAEADHRDFVQAGHAIYSEH